MIPLDIMEPIRFSHWEGPEGLKEFIIAQTGCRPFSGEGINIRAPKKTAILRSVDDTNYYDDCMENFINPKYTLFGQYGDQDENERRYNEPLLNRNKIDHIYLYRVVRKNGKTYEYLWYGKYSIVDRSSKLHQDKDNLPRIIIVLSLNKV